MSTSRRPITEFLSQSSNKLIIDVRSPAEYNHAHLPNAVNIPLFSNDERKIVGTAYKQQSREIAIKLGLDFFGPKMKAIVEEVEQLLNTNQTVSKNTRNGQTPTSNSVFLYCWRGGMRSAAVAWLLQLYGFNTVVLKGGYKTYRNFVLDALSLPFSLTILGGYTGSAKTEILQHLKESGECIVDLEGLAVHKGSAFGSLGMPAQPSQEMFENNLALELLKQKSSPVWIEDESQRIGNVNIPTTFWTTMRSSPVYFIDVPFEERLEHIMAGYGAFKKEDLADAIQRISKRLGPLETKTALCHVQENRVKDGFRILLTYYDKQYKKALQNRENLPALITTFTCETIGDGIAARLLKHHPV